MGNGGKLAFIVIMCIVVLIGMIFQGLGSPSTDSDDNKIKFLEKYNPGFLCFLNLFTKRIFQFPLRHPVRSDSWKSTRRLRRHLSLATGPKRKSMPLAAGWGR